MPESMNSAPEARDDLPALRAQIDRIDGELLLLMEERFRCVRAVAAQKTLNRDHALRLSPARERQLIERLERRSAELPSGAIAAVWRELMSHGLQVQQPVHILVCAPQQPVLVTDLARLRFGRAPEIVAANNAQDALDRARNRAAIAIVELSPLGNWWVDLFHDETLAIFDGLSDGGGRIVALAIGRIAAAELAPDVRFTVLGEAALRRRAAAGEEIRTLAMCGNLRLCVSRKAVEPRLAGEAA